MNDEHPQGRISGKASDQAFEVNGSSVLGEWFVDPDRTIMSKGGYEAAIQMSYVLKPDGRYDWLPVDGHGRFVVEGSTITLYLTDGGGMPLIDEHGTPLIVSEDGSFLTMGFPDSESIVVLVRRGEAPVNPNK